MFFIQISVPAFLLPFYPSSSGSGCIYLLNTDYDVPAVVKVISYGEEKTIILEPLELKTI